MKIIDSVAAVFCHQGNIFTVSRQAHLQAFPGYDSFPGGKIDPDDPATRHDSPFLQNHDARSMHALVREIEEELGYNLAAGIATGQVLSVKPLACVLAPPVVARRFRLHAYRIDLKTRPLFQLDPGEIASARWETPQQTLDRFASGDALIVPLLRKVLKSLASDPQVADLGTLSQQENDDCPLAWMELLSGVRHFAVPANTFPPERRTNAFLLGDQGEARILVDPSPESPRVLKRLEQGLGQEQLSALFLTHHHQDHHEQAPQLARTFGLPIFMSKITRELIIRKHGNRYFSGVQINLVSEGDEITRWKGEGVRVYAIPGHDAGQLGLAPESLRWFLVGDLVQSVGTVVIAPPEGDMGVYFQTLERLIALDPTVILPSHGLPMRGTHRLQETLDHRRQRETAIKDLFTRGKTITEILQLLYADIDQRLHPFARQNIEAHLEKLRQEGHL